MGIGIEARCFNEVLLTQVLKEVNHLKSMGFMLDFGIIGSGAIGLALFKLINLNQAKVQLFGRGDRLKDAKIYLIATKAFDAGIALQEIICSEIDIDIAVVLCNGFVINPFGQLNFPTILGSVSFGSFLEHGIPVISSINFDSIKIGSKDSHKNKCEGLLALPYCVWDDDIEKVAQTKWLFNTVINSLCAAHRLPRNGLLLDYPNELKNIFSEAFLLGEKLYGNFSTSNSKLWNQLLILVKGTENNPNSMFVDLERRRKTEAKYFSGCAIGLDGFSELKKLHGYLA